MNGLRFCQAHHTFFFAKEVCIDDNADFGNLSQKIGRA